MKKKVVFIIESLQLGGAEKSLITLLQNFDYALNEVDLLTFQSGGFFLDLLPTEVNLRVITFPKLSVKDRFYYKSKRFFDKGEHHSAQLFWPIIKKYFKIQEKHYDIAIAYNQGFSTYYTAEFIQAETKVSWLNTDYQKAGYKISFDYPYYQNFKTVIAVSPEAENGFKQALNKINKKLAIEIIKDITDKKLIQLQSLKTPKVTFDSTKTNIVSVGRLASPKGFHLAVKACSHLIKNGYNIHWYIIGEGGERKNLEKLIEEVGLSEVFLLLGADVNPYPYIKACDIYVQTSVFEGLGLTVIEASYLNKPIVSTNFPTVYGILKDEETGLIADMNAESIANKVERLIESEELRIKLSTNLEKQVNTDKELTLKRVNELLK